jgi:hypothetical protein
MKAAFGYDDAVLLGEYDPAVKSNPITDATTEKDVPDQLPFRDLG